MNTERMGFMQATVVGQDSEGQSVAPASFTVYMFLTVLMLAILTDGLFQMK